MPATPINPALIIAGPALVQHMGKTFYSKSNIELTIDPTTFNIDTSRFGVVELREDSLVGSLKFTPVGKLDSLNVLWAYRDIIPGRLVHLAKTVENVDDTNDELDITAHTFVDGHEVRIATYGALPGGLDGATLYYAKAVTANSLSLHPTRADALAGTNKVAITTVGTGTHRVIEQPSLVIHSFDGVKYTFHNAKVAQMPDINAGATVTAIGETTFNLYRKFATDPTDAAAVYTRAIEALADTSFDPADIPTEPFTLEWGAAAPWDEMSTKEGAVISFPMTLRECPDDAGGIISHWIDEVQAQCVAQPNNVDENALLQKKTLQNTGAGRGRRIIGDDLHIYSDSLYLILYGASITSAPANWDSKTDRLGGITWRANRTFAVGVPNPTFYLGDAAPV
jgi:hypothetical protein